MELKKTVEQYLRNIETTRREQGESIANFNFNKNRCRILSKCDKIKEKSNGILYWMSRDCRVNDNWALLYTQRLALKYQVPVFVCFLLQNAQVLYPTKRQFGFLIKGLTQSIEELKTLNITFTALTANPIEFANVINENDIGAVVCDFNPLKPCVQAKNEFMKNLNDDIPLVEVDAHNIVPAWESSNKQEIMARTIRPKIMNKLPEYLTEFPAVCKHSVSGKLNSDLILNNIDDAINFYKPQHNVNEIVWAKSGEKEGLTELYEFIKTRLELYAMHKNDPSKNYVSNLSPWLHFGQISAQRCALEVKMFEKTKNVGSFLEELIVRKELADNFCFYNDHYDSIECAADWAQKTLKDHRLDKRNVSYTEEQLEKGKTHDVMWNAAQKQLIQLGKIHGYMRMYWCKKILEWLPTPEQAIKFALWLNDIYSIDGTDPNGYTGVMWSICGIHDQGFKERPIFGKIRYMVDYSLARKFDMKAYCEQFGLTLDKGSFHSKKRKSNS